MTEHDYLEEQRRACDIEQEIDEEIEKEWSGEVPSDGYAWNKQVEVTNKALIRVVVLLEGIKDQLEARRDEG